MARKHSNPARTTIPLQLLSIGQEGEAHILANAKLANEPITLIVDTGSSLTSLRADITHNGSPVKLDDNNENPCSVSGTINNFSVIKVDSLIIGRLLLPPTTISLIDFSNIQQLYLAKFGMAIDGLLGSDILSRYNASISFSKRTLTLFNPEPKA